MTAIIRLDNQPSIRVVDLVFFDTLPGSTWEHETAAISHCQEFLKLLSNTGFLQV